MKKRIWELDALRGLCILGMVVVHFIYDLVELYGIVQWDYPALFIFIRDWGGVLFLLISGICVTLGSRCCRRGLLVFSCGMVCTAVTAGMYLLHFSGRGIIIYFGVLHCLGICMLLWPLVRKLPWQALLALGILFTATGLYFDTLPGINSYFLMPLGLPWKGFVSSDYFPLLPNFGYFLLGAVLGKTLYRSKQTLFPRMNVQSAPIRFLTRCGKHSLWIYLLHQPVLSGISLLISVI